MANLVYKRVSNDQQSTARQNLVLDEAGIEDPVVFEDFHRFFWSTWLVLRCPLP
ncbi:hypothetical protein [Streptomyces sp. NPDC046942]|uniref:hypothetical protein n=1 Tax=Streptomyces sp. NPDC046942 TaxID=3155137 RepID=UPI0033E5AEE2